MSAHRDYLAHALRYAAYGWPVFPCRPGGKAPCTPHGLKDATTDPGLIGAWWQTWPEANVAFRTGCEPGIVVLDVDGDEGAESLRALERKHGELPRTASVLTPRGGQHFYFAHPGGEIRNSAGRLGAGLDVRGEDGYVVAPPSLGKNGRRYQPDERRAPAPMPEWLSQRIADERSEDRKAAPPSQWMTMLRAGAAEGHRNDAMTRLTGHLLRHRVHVDVAAELVHLVNVHRCRPALPAEEVDRIIDSIAARELRRRQGAAR